MTDIGRVRSALSFIPPYDRDEWVRMGMAIKAAVGDDGFSLWNEWSAQADNYDQAAARDSWKSFRGGAITGGTLFHQAKANGWKDDGVYQGPTPEQLAERRARALENAEKERKRAERAAAKTKEIWKASTPARPDHPYLVRKQVKPSATLREIDLDELVKLIGYHPQAKGEPLEAGRVLVVPVKVGDGLSTCEFIDITGRKTALAGGQKAGGYWAAQPLPEGNGQGLRLLLGEGVTTCLSSGEAATDCPVVAALSCGNLLAVARMLRERYPAADLVILADLGNGQINAEEAATAVGGLLALPDFGPDRPEGATDMNDLMNLRGLPAVKACIIAATVPPSLKNDVTPVTDVQANNSGPSSVTADSKEAVTAVTVPEDERPCFKVLDDWATNQDGHKMRPGVWFFGIKQGKGEDSQLSQQWICAPIHVEAITFDGQENNFGRLLRMKNTLGRWRSWAMPMELLRGAGDELRGELLAMGIEIDPKAKNELARYLQAQHPKRNVTCALQVGWTGTTYVLPDSVIGPGADAVIFQSGERGHDEHTTGGTLDGWRQRVSARAAGNPFLILSLAGAFAGPLLTKTNSESGGVHFVGDSSTGKSTVIDAACSIWGGPNFKRSWRATSNGMEGAAALFNDCLLALDEISECDPREVGAIVYALGNGRGKQRASRTGTARGVTRWRCFVLSSGERTIGTTMQEGGHRVKAGQAVRLLDIPATRKHGAFDELHGEPSGAALSDSIKLAAATHYGHAGRAFLEKLTRDERNLCGLLEQAKTFAVLSAKEGEGQEKRAAGRFALMALAGELATEYGLTGWPEGAAIEAAAIAFDAWRAHRGRGNDERRQIVERLAGFIDRHGDSRFSDADEREELSGRRIDRAGWWQDRDCHRAYLFNSDGLREALRGFDFGRALDVLQEVGALPPPGANGERSRPVRIGGRVSKVYHIQADKLEGNDYGT